MIPLDQPPKLWLPPRPAIIRPGRDLLVLASFLPGMFPGGAAAAAVLPTVVFVASAGNGAAQNSYSFASQNFGTAQPTRRIIVAFLTSNSGGNLQPPSSVTIGGVGATLLLQDPAGTALTHKTLWIADVPTGASGTIVISNPGQMTFCAFCAWAAYDLVSATPHDTSVGSGTPTADVSVNTLSGGIVVGFAAEFGTGTPTFVWSGLNEDVDNVPAETTEVTGASVAMTATATPRSISVTASASVAVQGIAASFR